MDEIYRLIDYINSKHEEINDLWKNSDEYYPLNMKSCKVHDIYINENLLFYIFNYRNFISENTINVVDDIQNLSLINTVDTRVKALNSIQDKIEKYENKKEKGKIAVKKCLNDIYGLRIIIEDNISYEDIHRYIIDKYNKLKCIVAYRNEYKAVHIYFGDNDNKNFQWELQIWKKKDKKNNLDSHYKYKQEYTKWEKDNT